MDTRIGKYQIKRELGEGAASTVYLAYDEFYNSELALKVYYPDSQMGPGRGQFVSEAALAGKLVHPHIVTILDAAADALSSYVAMEYVPGGNLHRYTTTKRLLPVQDVIQIAFKCCGALDYAYREGVVHRDIKPANILIAEGTEVKVADFGAAFITGIETTHSMRMGSPSYIAPEQIRDEPLTHQSDMFSLGVVLYELLCGVRPFRGANTMETLDQVLRLTPPAPSQLRPELPAQIDPIVQRMIQKLPGERYVNWAELALDLARVGRLSLFDQTITDSEKYTALRASTLLSPLSVVEIWELVHAGHWRRLPRQTVLVREGDVGDSLFILAEGEAKVTIQGKLLNVLRAGECFGEMAYVRGDAAARGATVEATTDALAVALPRSAVEQLSIACQLHLTRALLRAMADRLTFANERISRASAAG